MARVNSGKDDSEFFEAISVKNDHKPVRAPGTRVRKQSIKLDGYEDVKLPKSLVIKKEDSSKVDLEEDLEHKKDETVSKADSKKVCIVYHNRMMSHRPVNFCLKKDKRMLQHNAPYLAYEVPGRLDAIMKTLRKHKVIERVKVLKPEPAKLEDMLAMHSSKHMNFIENLPLNKTNVDEYMEHYTYDMYCSSGTRDAVYLAAGGFIMGCEGVVNGDFQSAFAIVRPPGHHARQSITEGFCYANNVAIGASKLVRQHGIERVLVVDFDVHHGNGTQELFYNSDQVLFVSTYNKSLTYPSTPSKEINQIGEGKGEGYNINIPLSNKFKNADILFVWDEFLLPIAKEYNPQIILVSAGFDAAIGDPVGRCCLSAKCYATLVQKLMEVGTGRMVLSLEGGYDLPMLADCVSHCIRALLGDTDVLLEGSEGELPFRSTKKTIKELKALLWKWECFKPPEDPS